MTEKRFNIEIVGEKDVFIKEEGANYFLGINEYVNAGAICSLLNELNDENIRLKKERNHFERKKTEYLTEWNKSRIQNTELKQNIKENKKWQKKDNDKINELHWENHQLTTRIETIKNTIEEAYQNERTSLGRSVLKQLLKSIGE